MAASGDKDEAQFLLTLSPLGLSLADTSSLQKPQEAGPAEQLTSSFVTAL
jgi:hypothetical protein